MGWWQAVVRWWRALFGGRATEAAGLVPAAPAGTSVAEPPIGRAEAADVTLFQPMSAPAAPIIPPRSTAGPIDPSSPAGAPPVADAPPMRIDSDARSHEGKVRSVNEDSFFAAERIGVWAVADGMGGHERGEWASERLVEAFAAIDGSGGFETTCAAIPERIRAANAAIFAEAQARGQQMGSTIVALAVHGALYCVFWVGDSRAYLLRGGELIRLSRDHTQVQQMVDRGLMDPGDVEGHPMGHVLSRAVGVQAEVDVEEATGRVEPGDTFLLCSDGLHGYVPEADIARILARGSPREASEKLVQTTLERGAPDNVTVITISVSEPTLLTLPEPVKAS